jgi:predicted GNAT family acetyltransferase
MRLHAQVKGFQATHGQESIEWAGNGAHRILEKTHLLGPFIGVRREGRLVAMAGVRLNLDGFTEVSGVCTHPDHRGRGYAGALMRVVAERMLARGETPWLHAYASNSGAIALYESLGFRLHGTVTASILVRPGA